MGEQVLLYSAAAILSACVAAMGFKIADKSKGGVSITKMVSDLAKSAVPGFKVIVGTAAMGLNPGLFYAYMQVVNGKTSVPQNLISWIQDWLNKNSVYDGLPVIENLYTVNQLREQNITGKFAYKPVSVEEVVVAMKPYILSRFNGNETYYNKFLESAKAATQYKGLLISFKSTSRGSIEFNIYEETEPIDCNFTPTATPWMRISYAKQHEYSSTYGSFSENQFAGKTNYFTYLSSYNYTSINATVSYGNDTGIEAGENVPGKDVVIPGEGTGDITNEDIVGWLQSAVGAAVASALGIGTASIPFVPVAVKNPAITGDITDALDNVIDQVQNIAQAGATDIDNVAIGDKYANTSLAPSKPSGNVSASSLYTIWNPSQAQLNNLASFLWSTDFVDTIKKILQSPMDALISLALFPVTPPTDGTHNISLGYIDSGVAAKRVSDQFMTVQTSGLVVPHKYNSYLDYAPYTRAEIFLPFIGFCPLNINDIMGKSVDVTYNIDLLSGVCTAIVHANAQSLYSYSGNMAMFLPLSAGNWARMLTPIFGMVGGVTSLAAGIGGVIGGAPLLASTSMAVRGAESIGNMDGNSVSRSGGISGNAGIMGDYQPFIVVTRPINDKPTTYDSNIGQTYNKSARLGTLSGFTIIEEAHIEGMNATDAEKQEIEQLLKEGVIL